MGVDTFLPFDGIHASIKLKMLPSFSNHEFVLFPFKNAGYDVISQSCCFQNTSKLASVSYISQPHMLPHIRNIQLKGVIEITSNQLFTY